MYINFHTTHKPVTIVTTAAASRHAPEHNPSQIGGKKDENEKKPMSPPRFAVVNTLSPYPTRRKKKCCPVILGLSETAKMTCWWCVKRLDNLHIKFPTNNNETLISGGFRVRAHPALPRSRGQAKLIDQKREMLFARGASHTHARTQFVVVVVVIVLAVDRVD